MLSTNSSIFGLWKSVGSETTTPVTFCRLGYAAAGSAFA